MAEPCADPQLSGRGGFLGPSVVSSSGLESLWLIPSYSAAEAAPTLERSQLGRWPSRRQDVLGLTLHQPEVSSRQGLYMMVPTFLGTVDPLLSLAPLGPEFSH